MHLTPRERQIMELVALGKINKEIAAELGISKWTVRAFLEIIYDKLEVNNRIEAINRARLLGLLPSLNLFDPRLFEYQRY